MGFEGCTINNTSAVAHCLAEDGLGGVLLFDKDLHKKSYGKNLKDPSQIKLLIAQLKQFAAKLRINNESIPLLVAIDYEGGAVDRLAKIDGCMDTLTAVELAKLTDSDLEEEMSQMADSLRSFGFNLNFAPVVDLALNEKQGIIGGLKRSFSADPEVVTRIASKFVDVFSRYGIACAYKHFPGHGSAAGDTHTDFVDVTDSFQNNELTPYRNLLTDAHKPVMVMTAHVINKNLDNEGLPATLSKTILTNLLRQEMGFEGVIISDDMQMQAISKHYSWKEALCLTINAGSDMLIIGNQLGSIAPPKVIDIIEQLVLTNKIEVARIDDAFRRIMRLKQQMLNK